MPFLNVKNPCFEIFETEQTIDKVKVKIRMDPKGTMKTSIPTTRKIEIKILEGENQDALRKVNSRGRSEIKITEVEKILKENDHFAINNVKNEKVEFLMKVVYKS